MTDLILLGVAGFFQVFLLVLNSQFARDGKVGLAFCFSWMISVAQFMFIRLIATMADPYPAFFVAALGSSLGVSASIIFYRWLKPRIMKGNNNESN